MEPVDIDELDSFRCAECEADFPSREALREHARAVHRSEEMPTVGEFRCEACGLFFDTQETLAAHHRIAHAA